MKFFINIVFLFSVFLTYGQSDNSDNWKNGSIKFNDNTIVEGRIYIVDFRTVSCKKERFGLSTKYNMSKINEFTIDDDLFKIIKYEGYNSIMQLLEGGKLNLYEQININKYSYTYIDHGFRGGQFNITTKQIFKPTYDLFVIDIDKNIEKLPTIPKFLKQRLLNNIFDHDTIFRRLKNDSIDYMKDKIVIDLIKEYNVYFKSIDIKTYKTNRDSLLQISNTIFKEPSLLLYNSENEDFNEYIKRVESIFQNNIYVYDYQINKKYHKNNNLKLLRIKTKIYKDGIREMPWHKIGTWTDLDQNGQILSKIDYGIE